jgi:hypothetical protein
LFPQNFVRIVSDFFVGIHFKKGSNFVQNIPQSLAHDLSWAFTLRERSNAEHCERDSNAGAGEFGLEPKRKVGARRGETGMRDFSAEKYF